jgi:hypothetical protein
MYGKALSRRLHWNWAHFKLCLVWAIIPIKLMAFIFTYYLRDLHWGMKSMAGSNSRIQFASNESKLVPRNLYIGPHLKRAQDMLATMGEGGTYLVTRDSRLVSRIPDLEKTFCSPQSKEYRG